MLYCQVVVELVHDFQEVNANCSQLTTSISGHLKFTFFGGLKQTYSFANFHRIFIFVKGRKGTQLKCKMLRKE